MYKKAIYTLRSNERLTPAVWRMTLEGDTQWITAPGQFVNVELDGCYLRRPISVCDWDERTITLIYKVVGEGTALMAGLRETPPGEIAGYAVEAVGDYQQSVLTRRDGTQEEIRLPRSNVLRFFLSGGLEAVVRPSGTEPKLKVYITAVGAGLPASSAAADRLAEYFAHWADGK